MSEKTLHAKRRQRTRTFFVNIIFIGDFFGSLLAATVGESAGFAFLGGGSVRGWPLAGARFGTRFFWTAFSSSE